MSDSESSYDDSLDLGSEHFDPLKALYSPNVSLPCPSAKSLDNLAQYASVAEKFAGKRTDVKKKPDEPTPSTSQDASSEVPVRRFEKYGAAMTMVPRKGRVYKNVLTRMETCEPTFSRLWECCQADPPSRIRVITRHSHGVRGTLDGYVVAFDKHFNMAMSDVTEIWYRTTPSRKTKLPFLGDPEEVPDEGRSGRDIVEDSLATDLSALAISHRSQRLPRKAKARVYENLPQGELPTATLKKPGSIMGRPLAERGRGGHKGGTRRDDRRGQGRPGRPDLLDAWQPLPTVYWRPHGKRQECERHIDQLLVRGEHVVLIQFPPKLEPTVQSIKTEKPSPGKKPST